MCCPLQVIPLLRFVYSIIRLHQIILFFSFNLEGLHLPYHQSVYFGKAPISLKSDPLVRSFKVHETSPSKVSSHYRQCPYSTNPPPFPLLERPYFLPTRPSVASFELVSRLSGGAPPGGYCQAGRP
jgi:hypothetical protein